MSTKKSIDFAANSGQLLASFPKETTHSLRTSRYSSSKPCMNAPHAPVDIKLIDSSSCICESEDAVGIIVDEYSLENRSFC